MKRNRPRKSGTGPPRGPVARKKEKPGLGRRLFGRLSWKLRAATLLTVIAGLVGTIVLSVAFIYYTIRFPDPSALRLRERAPVVRVLAADGTMLAERGAAYDYMPFDLLPRHVINAVVATEDRRFFQHCGIDPIGLVRAMLANLRARGYVQGGSTLTQQLAKNLFLSPERSLRRKVEELIIALWLEARLSKEDILELYLNRVYFGAGAYGIEAAAQRYFGKSARHLTIPEAAVLAGVLKAPSRYSPATSPRLARLRARIVLKRMLAAGHITPAEELAAVRKPARFASERTDRGPSGYEYAVDYVLERLPPLIGDVPSQVIVETTIDANLQRQAQSIVQRALDAEGRSLHASQAAVVVMDAAGRIQAMVGGRAWSASQFNRAVKAQRQPGSAFKPIVYLAAVQQGAMAETMVTDAPVTIKGWSPRNDSGDYQGQMTLRQALAGSVNTVAVRLQQQVGTSRVIALAHKLGIQSELRESPSLALGTSEVSLLEMTGVYAVLAGGGYAVVPHVVQKVRTSTGTLLYSAPTKRQRVLVAPAHVGILSDMLHTALVSGTGKRAALASQVAAGKTGTTQDFRDAWFLGYTAQLAAGVWVGNDDASPMRRVTGGSLPARIWRGVMQAAHEHLAAMPLPGVTEAGAGTSRVPATALAVTAPH